MYEELVGSKKSNFKKYLLFGVIAAVIVALVVTAIILVTKKEDSPDAQPSTDESLINLEDILFGRLQAKRFNGTWISDTQIIYRDLEGGVILYDAAKNQKHSILGIENVELAEGFKFDLSSDQRYLLVAREYRKIFRHSFLARYDIVDLQDGNKIYPITINGDIALLNLAIWSPTGHSIAFVFRNNVYYKESPMAREIPITTDGSQSIYNGVPDWVNEEEVFSTNTALWFSKDGKYLSYIRFDDTNTPRMKFPVYGLPGIEEFQYPHELLLYYPKTGTKNPEVKLFQVDIPATVTLQTPKRHEIMPPLSLVNEKNDHLITAIGWSSNNQLVSVWKNRIQNHAIIQSCDINNQCLQIFESNLEATGGWLELFTEPIFNKNGTLMTLILSQDQGNDAGGYRHVTVLSTLTNQQYALTRGKFVVQEIFKWDPETNFIFYSANTETDSQALHIYAVNAARGSKSICLTCTLKYEKKQTYFSAQFSKKGNYVIISAAGPHIPQIDLFEWNTTNNSVQLKHLMVWESNSDLKTYLNYKNLPQIHHHEIKLSHGFTSKVSMMIPPNADLSGKRKYPVLVDVYGGPNSYGVTDSFSLDWGSYFTGNQSIIYVKIDGRGSGLRGDKLLFQIYKRLGTVEIEDQIETMEKLTEQFPYLDKNRTAIWGWSYGGYASALSLAKDDKKVFKCAASVAPVTDWTLYDSIYTERFMRLPTLEDNKVGYENSRLTALGEKFRNRKYMLVHGTLDDNVHYQQSMMLARVLERDDILFKQATYPDEDHGLAGVRPHLYHMLGRFFSNCFNGRDVV
uniref:Venom dipeptidyl peptidase 4 n=1 Tax=Corethrella appendiculata TaxID=1370023 RepID=U5EWK1_9DIPT